MKVESKYHWENIYHTKETHLVSWFQQHAVLSMQLIESTASSKDAAIIDVGGGASVLVDDLLHENFNNITVLDIAEPALQKSQQRLGEKAQLINWKVDNILNAEFDSHAYDIWHDRAVFHFLTNPTDQERYIEQVKHAVKPNGYVIVATFAEDGPQSCSGLDVQRYSQDALREAFTAADVALKHCGKWLHVTPAGNEQQFSYCVFQRQSGNE